MSGTIRIRGVNQESTGGQRSRRFLSKSLWAPRPIISNHRTLSHWLLAESAATMAESRDPSMDDSCARLLSSFVPALMLKAMEQAKAPIEPPSTHQYEAVALFAVRSASSATARRNTRSSQPFPTLHVSRVRSGYIGLLRAERALFTAGRRGARPDDVSGQHVFSAGLSASQQLLEAPLHTNIVYIPAVSASSLSDDQDHLILRWRRDQICRRRADRAVDRGLKDYASPPRMRMCCGTAGQASRLPDDSEHQA